MEKTTCNPNLCQFIDYIPTPGEKHSGIAKVLLYNKLIVLFKWMPTKDGANHFICPPAFKIGERYENAISIDSKSENEMIEKYIRAEVTKKMMEHATPKIQMSASAHAVPDLDGCPF